MISDKDGHMFKGNSMVYHLATSIDISQRPSPSIDTLEDKSLDVGMDIDDNEDLDSNGDSNFDSGLQISFGQTYKRKANPESQRCQLW